MQTRVLEGSIGVEITGLDLAGGAVMSREEIERLRALWDRPYLLLLRGAECTGEQQLAFVGRFGKLLAERRPWGYVSNVRDDAVVREGALLFHSDFAFTSAPIHGICLHALQVPADGAPTRFADACAAVDRLPAELRARLEGLRVLNWFDFGQGGAEHIDAAVLATGSPSYAHPVIGRHPRTGRPVIMANQMHSERLPGLPRAESDALLAAVFEVLYDPVHVLTHYWSHGDLVLWDNVALHHGRDAPPCAEARTLQRVTLGDHTPAELVPHLDRLLSRARTQGAPHDNPAPQRRQPDRHPDRFEEYA